MNKKFKKIGDKKETLEFLGEHEKAIANDPDTLFILGGLYWEGMDGLRKDRIKAMEYFDKSNKQFLKEFHQGHHDYDSLANHFYLTDSENVDTLISYACVLFSLREFKTAFYKFKELLEIDGSIRKNMQFEKRYPNSPNSSFPIYVDKDAIENFVKLFASVSPEVASDPQSTINKILSKLRYYCEEDCSSCKTRKIFIDSLKMMNQRKENFKYHLLMLDTEVYFFNYKLKQLFYSSPLETINFIRYDTGITQRFRCTLFEALEKFIDDSRWDIPRKSELYFHLAENKLFVLRSAKENIDKKKITHDIMNLYQKVSRHDQKKYLLAQQEVFFLKKLLDPMVSQTKRVTLIKEGITKLKILGEGQISEKLQDLDLKFEDIDEKKLDVKEILSCCEKNNYLPELMTSLKKLKTASLKYRCFSLIRAHCNGSDSDAYLFLQNYIKHNPNDSVALYHFAFVKEKNLDPLFADLMETFKNNKPLLQECLKEDTNLAPETKEKFSDKVKEKNGFISIVNNLYSMFAKKETVIPTVSNWNVIKGLEFQK